MSTTPLHAVTADVQQIALQNFTGHYVMGQFLKLIDDGRTDKDTGEHKSRYRIGIKLFSIDKYDEVTSTNIDVAIREDDVRAIRNCEIELKGRMVLINVEPRPWSMGDKKGVTHYWVSGTSIREVNHAMFHGQPLREGSVAAPIEKHNAPAKP